MPWRAVVGFEGLYEVSDAGEVRSLSYNGTGEVRNLRQNWSRGYRRICLHKGPHKTYHGVHSLVAAAFIGQRPDGYHINHKNGVKHDNAASNLEYVTPSRNRAHAFEIGLQSNKGEKHSRHKLTESKVIEIRRRISLGEKQKSVALDFDIHQGTVSDIASGKAWPHVALAGG